MTQVFENHLLSCMVAVPFVTMPVLALVRSRCVDRESALVIGNVFDEVGALEDRTQGSAVQERGRDLRPAQTPAQFLRLPVVLGPATNEGRSERRRRSESDRKVLSQLFSLRVK